MDKLLQELKKLGLKHSTVQKGDGCYTYLVPINEDFDPYESPVFGTTEYESLKNAIESHDAYMELALEFPEL